ncbi:MAG TPA: isoprenylcysteine carboxylmethyltransferase family protein [Ignavibacteriaceae bacterium]|nr:isoprenylcysteine carboxylmethyltransferase family protein [Ignavibacteriaceae bacterium]
MKIVKQLFSFILPVTALIIIPILVERNFKPRYMFTTGPGLLLIFAGLILMALTISSFIKIGKGTLAPWSPTKKLVTKGLYAHVRNPMILGVLIILLGESIMFLSVNILAWAVIFFLINNIYFSVSEEPGLEKRFGDEYLNYKKNVPRWIPRLKPFLNR